MTKLVRVCPTGKIVYPTKSAATAALRDMQPASGGRTRRREIRAYRCPVCWQFHTTSKPRRDEQRRSNETAA